jgi:hypothetical protein
VYYPVLVREGGVYHIFMTYSSVPPGQPYAYRYHTVYEYHSVPVSQGCNKIKMTNQNDKPENQRITVQCPINQSKSKKKKNYEFLKYNIFDRII